MSENAWAESGDESAVSAFLMSHVDRAMFPLSNLRNHGLSGGSDRYASRFFVSWDRGAIRGVTALSSEGLLLPVGEPDLSALHDTLLGYPITGVLGETQLVRQLITLLGLDNVPCMMKHDEPHFALSLSQLRMPETTGLSLHPLSEVPYDMAVSLRAGTVREVIGESPDRVEARAARDVDSYLAADTHRLLKRDGEWVSMTGFNAVLFDMVQIGAVYTPPEFRNQGLARAAVALHLTEARASGIERAVLFAASSPAARAYRALGFQEIGRYSIYLFHEAQNVVTCL